MVITLTYCGTKKGTEDNVKIYFPVLPEQIGYKSAAHFHEYTIINKGAAKIPNGEDISTIGWESFFPGAKLKGNPYVSGKWESPKTLHNRLESWRKGGKKLKLNITGTPFSFWVYIDKYEASVQDAYGSIYYSIEFSKAVSVSVEKVAKKKKSKSKTTGTRAKKSTQKKYTVKKDDCLWDISKKFYKDATQWKKIYNANKTAIEKTAKKHGKKSSNQGWWIFPGQVLKIP